jgi:hypothetical protein
MKIELGEAGLASTYQAPHEKEVDCRSCGEPARIAFVATEEGDGPFVSDLHDNKPGSMWVHDCASYVVYHCTGCLTPTVRFNQA